MEDCAEDSEAVSDSGGGRGGSLVISWQVCPACKNGGDDAVAHTQVMKGGCLKSRSFFTLSVDLQIILAPKILGASWGNSLVAVHGFLFMMASLVAEHEL